MLAVECLWLSYLPWQMPFVTLHLPVAQEYVPGIVFVADAFLPIANALDCPMLVTAKVPPVAMAVPPPLASA